MSQQARFLLFVALSVGILTVWSHFFAPKPTPKLDTAPPVPAAVAPAPAPVPSPVPSAPVEGDGGEPVPPVATTVVETADWTAGFSSEGAALQSFVLKGDKQRRHGTTGGVEMVHPGEGQPQPLSVEAAGLFGPKTVFRLVSHTAEALVFERTLGGVTMTKSYRFEREGYRVGLEVALRKADGSAVTGDVKVVYPAFEAAPKRSGLFSQGEVHQAACFFDGDRSMETRLYGTEDKPALTFDRSAAFAALDEKFFLAALAPRQGPAKCVLTAPSAQSLEAALSVPLTSSGAGSTAAFDLYLGPKETGRLQAFGHEADVAIYNGSIAKAGKLLLPVLKAFHTATRNWGLAIILLTLLVKALTFPLAQKQMTSMEKMKALGPKLEAMKKQFEGDPQRQQVETMKLYKEHDISPVGCAVPMLVQMPIWWALYATLQNSFELFNEPFLFWIHDLTAADPFYVLPVLMTASMLITQRLTPQTSPQAEQMKTMTYAMPVMFGFMMMSLPAGLVLYIFTNNLLSISHSLWFRRRQAARGSSNASAGAR